MIFEIWVQMGRRFVTLRGTVDEFAAVLRTVARLHPRARLLGGWVR